METNTPILTELCQPSNLTTSDLLDVEHPVNNRGISGKRNGMACLIGKILYMATGSNAASEWLGFSTIKLANERIINSIEDFEVQDEDTITLEASLHYKVGAVGLVTSKRFIVEKGAILEASNSLDICITSTATGSMFTSTNGWFIRNIRVSCPNATALTLTGSAAFTEGFVATNFVVDGCINAGVITNMTFIMDISGFTNITNNGLTFSGSLSTISITKVAMQSTANNVVCIDLGTSVAFNIEIKDFEPFMNNTCTSLNIASGGANLAAGSVGVVKDSTLNRGGITPLTGGTSYDIRWDMQSNAGVQDTANTGKAYLSGGEVTIPITTSGVYQEVGVPTGGVTWESSLLSRCTLGSDGVLTYTGERPIRGLFIGKALVEKVGGGSDEIEVRLAKNWQGVSDTGLESSAGATRNNTKTQVIAEDLIELVTGDTVRLIFTNNDSTSDVITRITGFTFTN